MAKHACKCKPHTCEECPEWIFTFADLVMLMMGFFVILWVLKPAPGNTVDKAVDERWYEVVAKIREAFGRLPDPDSKDPVDMHILMKKIELLKPPLKGDGKGGETTEPREGATGTDPLVTHIRPGSHVGTGGRMLFAVGEARLSPDTVKVLDEVVRVIRGHRNIIQVKGHTSLDDFPERSGATPQQQMDLSLRRAQAAADHLIARGVTPDIIRVQWCSAFEPVVLRTYTPDAQSFNRRVEVEATDVLVPERQGNGGKPSPAPTAVTTADRPAVPASPGPSEPAAFHATSQPAQ